MVMIGHDVIPHMDDSHQHMSEQAASSQPGSNNNDFNDLQHALSHFKHISAEPNLVYVSATEKNTDCNAKVFLSFPFIAVAVNDQAIWYSNYMKQRFWSDVSTPISFYFNFFSFRGPPAV
jgi:hypothetical protein